MTTICSQVENLALPGDENDHACGLVLVHCALNVSARSYQPRRRPGNRAPSGRPPDQAVELFPISVALAVTPSSRPSRDASGAMLAVGSLYAATRRDGAVALALGDLTPSGPVARAPDLSLLRSNAAALPEDTPTAPGDDAWLPPRS